MAVILEGGCRVSEMREGVPVEHGALRIWNQIGRATGAQAISLRVLEFAPGLSPGIRNDGCDEILYALDESWSGEHRGPEGVEYNSQGQAHSAIPLNRAELDRPRRGRIVKLFI